MDGFFRYFHGDFNCSYMICALWQCIVLLTSIIALPGCSGTATPKANTIDAMPVKATMAENPAIDYDTATWKELTAAMGFVIDMRYATTDNFVREKIYPCGRCFLKKEAAQRLIRVNAGLRKKNYALRLLDCYRPAPAQQKLWDKVPDRNYVAPPWEGSMHTRGGAVDLTITDQNGRDLDMGTAYDFFGLEAHHMYTKHTAAVNANRKLLKESMEAAGFRSIRTEWWHYSIGDSKGKLHDWQWKCEN
jgi:D-alanyl-D-alanine dipeptidase